MASNKSRKLRTKSSAKSSVVLAPQPHGGALQIGNPGNSGGGRPKDHVRSRLIEISRGKGMDFLDRLMDGKVTYRLVGKCDECGYEGEPMSPTEAKGMVGDLEASIDHRLKALEQTLKYGIGQKDETTLLSPEITDRLQATVNLISTRAPALLTELEAIWK